MQAVKSIHGIAMSSVIITTINICKGLFNIHIVWQICQCFRETLCNNTVSKKIKPHWIKSRHNNQAKPLLLSFREKLPLCLDIPGKNMKSKVYEYKERPAMRKKCLQYGHTKNSCRDNQRCAKCGEDNHEVAKCTENEPKCLHCSKDHLTGNYKCVEYRYQEEIVAIQCKENESRGQAKAIFDRPQPDYRQKNYANAVKVQKTMSSENKEREGSVQCSEKNNNANHKTQVDILCVSPNSGNLYPSRVLLPADTPGISDIEDGTSETSRGKISI